jgi:arabinogalactan oligomer/maltooligosaccharide transport system substrate-binding protein
MLPVLAVLVAGCRALPPLPRPPWPTVLFLSVGISDDNPVTPELLERGRRQLHELTEAFRKVHPSISIQLQVFTDTELRRQLARRNRTGLGPDLLLVQGITALELERQGLVRPMRFPATVTDELQAGPRMRLSLNNGQLAGLPYQLIPELACFDRRRLRQAPRQLEELVERSGTGLRVGLASELSNIVWTAGALGANPALTRAAQGMPLSGSEHRTVEGWLAWLQSASLQKELGFFSAEQQVQELIAGRLDWITCRSTHLPRLRKALGEHLGVSALPAGPGGDATPVTRDVVWAFGVGSSPRQRQAAEDLAVFTIRPLIQRGQTVRDMDVLPVNRRVAVPVASSSILAAMVTSQRQSQGTDPLNQELRPGDPRLPQMERLLSRLVVGELEPTTAARLLMQELGATP